jgi:hypothetical protein
VLKKAGIGLPMKRFKPHQIPAFAGMTETFQIFLEIAGG